MNLLDLSLELLDGLLIVVVENLVEVVLLGDVVDAVHGILISPLPALLPGSWHRG